MITPEEFIKTWRSGHYHDSGINDTFDFDEATAIQFAKDFSTQQTKEILDEKLKSVDEQMKKELTTIIQIIGDDQYRGKDTAIDYITRLRGKVTFEPNDRVIESLKTEKQQLTKQLQDAKMRIQNLEELRFHNNF